MIPGWPCIIPHKKGECTAELVLVPSCTILYSILLSNKHCSKRVARLSQNYIVGRWSEILAGRVGNLGIIRWESTKKW